ncbi:MAG: MFS transporter [Actinobacteria bacterium]|nr:MFS transporter [Actinomycetota bacterium]
MRPFAAYLRSLNPRLPRSVQTLQLGALLNAFGNGIAYPFLFIYLHNVRGFSLGTAGLIVATNAGVSLFSGPLAGALVDKLGGKKMLAASLILMAIGFGAYPLVHSPWQGFLASAVAGAGNGAFWPSQSSLLAKLTPPDRTHATWAMQRIVMNLGIGIGGLTGGLLANAERPSTFTILFLADAATFLLYIGALFFVPEPPLQSREERAGRGGYGVVLRNRVFVALLGLNFLLIAAGLALLEVLPAYVKNEAAVSERGIGLIFLVNTLMIGLAQLPISRLSEGRRRVPVLAGAGIISALAWFLVPAVGSSVSGVQATLLFAAVVAVFGIGECLHGAVYAPLVVDLADRQLIGRYMAASAFSWSIGFAVGPAVAGFILAASPNGLWLMAAAVLLGMGVATLTLEKALPRHARRTPLGRPAAELAPAEA